MLNFNQNLSLPTLLTNFKHMKKTVFSGIQPSGNLHLGNYLGSVANWVPMQDQHQCIFGIMDLHAITVFQNPEELKQSILECAAIYLACGLDPKKTIIFQQSEVKEHAELAWILGTLTPLGWLNRMTQFKDKTAKSEDNSNLGLYAYPVLMAADILLYKTDAVPVGEDQKQHLELTRDIAGAFNRAYNQEFFKLPDPLILGNCARVMSLLDGTKKMSKSDESDLSRINLSDDADAIRKKIKKCKTDSVMGISYDKNRPEIYNLLNIFSGVTGEKPEIIAKNYENSGFGKFKEDLAEAVISKLEPVSQNFKSLKADPTYIKKILQDGGEAAKIAASSNMAEIKKIVGLI